jgi:hypothetical protein
MSKKCVKIEVFKDLQDDSKYNQNNSSLYGTSQYVAIDDFVETKNFEGVNNVLNSGID